MLLARERIGCEELVTSQLLLRFVNLYLSMMLIGGRGNMFNIFPFANMWHERNSKFGGSSLFLRRVAARILLLFAT